MDSIQHSPDHERIHRSHFLVLGLIFLLGIGSLATIYILFPKMDPYVSTGTPIDPDGAIVLVRNEWYSNCPRPWTMPSCSVTFSTNTVNTIDTSSCLPSSSRISCKCTRSFSAIYTLLPFSLQTFAIPGSIFLTILAGFLYPFPLALFLVCLCSALGASFCYLLSKLFGRAVLLKYFRTKIICWQQKVTPLQASKIWPQRGERIISFQVKSYTDNLLWFMIFLRITPILPNWFINLCSPILDVPLKPFFLGTFAGVALPSILFIQAGKTLHQLSSASDAVSWRSMLLLAACAMVSLLPIYVKDRVQTFFTKNKSK